MKPNMTMPTKMLSCNQLNKGYSTSHNQVWALQNVSFSISSHEFVCLIGPSGCGKSTLLRLIAGLDAPSAGEITFGTPDPIGKQRTAMIFQEYGLFPWMTVLDNLAFALEMQGVEQRERREKAQVYIQKLGLAGFENRYPHELSGGMRQRVGIGRAWLADADILLMDEPFGALDAQTRLLMQQELLTIWKEQRKTVIYVTHDIEEAILLADRVLVMSARPGRILEEIPIPLTRPRRLMGQATSDEQAIMTEYRWHIWKKLEAEVRQSH